MDGQGHLPRAEEHEVTVTFSSKYCLTSGTMQLLVEPMLEYFAIYPSILLTVKKAHEAQ